MQKEHQFTNFSTLDNNVKQVSYFKASQDHRELKELIGFCNWLSHFIRAGDKEAKVRDLISVKSLQHTGSEATDHNTILVIRGNLT